MLVTKMFQAIKAQVEQMLSPPSEEDGEGDGGEHCPDAEGVEFTEACDEGFVAVAAQTEGLEDGGDAVGEVQAE